MTHEQLKAFLEMVNVDTSPQEKPKAAEDLQSAAINTDSLTGRCRFVLCELHRQINPFSLR